MPTIRLHISSSRKRLQLEHQHQPKQQQGGNLWSPEKGASRINGYKRSETDEVPVSLKRMALDGSLDVDMVGLFIGVLPNENSKMGGKNRAQ